MSDQKNLFEEAKVIPGGVHSPVRSFSGLNPLLDLSNKEKVLTSTMLKVTPILIFV